MRIERRKLTYNHEKRQVQTTMRAIWVEKTGIQRDGMVNLIFDKDHHIIIICEECNLDPTLNYLLMS